MKILLSAIIILITIVPRTTIIRGPQDFHGLKMATGGTERFKNGFPVYVWCWKIKFGWISGLPFSQLFLGIGLCLVYSMWTTQLWSPLSLSLFIELPPNFNPWCNTLQILLIFQLACSITWVPGVDWNWHSFHAISLSFPVNLTVLFLTCYHFLLLFTPATKFQLPMNDVRISWDLAPLNWTGNLSWRWRWLLVFAFGEVSEEGCWAEGSTFLHERGSNQKERISLLLEMKFMKLGTRPDTFYTLESVR